MGHYCSEHQTLFFHKGAMKGYAHPIVDKDSNPILNEKGKPRWCNEPEGGGDELSNLPPATNPGEAQTIPPVIINNTPADPTRKSIERQTALKASTEITVAKIAQGDPETYDKTIARAGMFESYLEYGDIAEKEKGGG